MLVQLVLLAAAAATPIWLASPDTAVAPAIRLLGEMLMGIGGVLAVLGAAGLGRALTPFPKPLEQGGFRQGGAYRFVRHPIYAGLVAAALGWSLYHGSWPGLGVDGVLLFFLDRKASREEKWLLEKYPGYDDYRKSVRKLIPWIY